MRIFFLYEGYSNIDRKSYTYVVVKLIWNELEFGEIICSWDISCFVVWINTMPGELM